jgi:hypothetical protein
MNDSQLPAELQQLERDLGGRSLPGSAADLRQTVLADVRLRLRAQRSRDRWQFALAVVAAALLWMNLSLSATQATDFGFGRSQETEGRQANIDLMRRSMPWLLHAEKL